MSELAATNAPYRFWVAYLGLFPFGLAVLFFAREFFIGNIHLNTASQNMHAFIHPSMKRTTIAAYSFIIASLGIITLSLFPCDPGCPVYNASAINNMHNLSAAAAFFLIIVVQLLLGSLWFSPPHKNFYYLICFILGILSVPLYIMFKLTSPLFFIEELMPYKGLAQRSLVTNYLIWWVISGFYIYTKTLHKDKDRLLQV